jgi:cold shock CspA family protein
MQRVPPTVQLKTKLKGTIISFYPSRAYGFILSEDQSSTIFYHLRSVLNARKNELYAGMTCEYSELQNNKDYPEAIGVVVKKFKENENE